MYFSTFSAALVFAATALAQTAGFDAIAVPAKDEKIAAGTTYTIKWDPNDVTGTVTLTLLQGETSSTLQIGETIATGVENQLGQYSWSVDSSLGQDATYGIKISLDTDSATFQYSFPFQITTSTHNPVVTPVSSGSTTPAASSTAPASTTVPASTSAPAGATTPAGTDTFTSYTASVSSSSSSSIPAPATTISYAPTTLSKLSFPTMVDVFSNSTTNSTQPSNGSPVVATAGAFSNSGATVPGATTISNNATARPTTTAMSGASRAGAASSIAFLGGVAAVFFALT